MEGATALTSSKCNMLYLLLWLPYCPILVINVPLQSPKYFVIRQWLITFFIIWEKKNSDQVHCRLMSNSSTHVTPTKCDDNTSQIHMLGTFKLWQTVSITFNCSSLGVSTCFLCLSIRSCYPQSRTEDLQQNLSSTHSLPNTLQSSVSLIRCVFMPRPLHFRGLNICRHPLPPAVWASSWIVNWSN